MTTLLVKSKVLLIIFILFPVSLSFAGNPFLHMIGKPYADYMLEMKLIHYKLDYIEQSQADSLMAYMEEATRIAGNRTWEVEAEMFRIAYNFRYYTRIAPNCKYTIENVLKDYQTLCDAAKQENDTITHLRMLRGIMNAHVLNNNYDLAFETAKMLSRELEHISTSQLPEKLLAYREMGELHYKFRNYVEAEPFFQKIINDSNAIHFSVLQPAYNTLGLIYRYHYNNPEESDAYFRQILTVPDQEISSEEHCRAWEAISKGNIGTNFCQRGEYDEAIPLLEYARKIMVDLNDYNYAGSMATLLAHIYLEKKNLVRCKQYLDMGVDYIQRSYPKQRWERMYPVMAKYYTTIGNVALAAAYQDSALAHQRKAYMEYDALKLVYAEQQANRLHQQAKEEELQLERVQTVYYKQVTFYVGVILLIILVLLLYATMLYRRKRMAYRELVKKSQAWAAARKTPIKTEEIGISAVGPNDTSIVSPNDTSTVDPDDAFAVDPNASELALMERIQQLMDKEKAYVDPNFTLTEIVARLGVNRTYVSTTLKRCAGKTLTQYINEYRISEAVNIMSNKENQYLTIDNIAYNSGFSDRRTFHRIFKNITGLTPTEFRSNLPGQSLEISE